MDTRRYAVVRSPPGLRFWFPGLAQAELDEQRQTLTVRPDPGAATGLVELLLGSMLAMILTVRGATILHASAVSRGDRAIAVVGAEGGGKSTLAALLVRDGARLVTDDVLRIGVEQFGVTWSRGTTDLRLRAHARQVALEPALVSTPDGRWAQRAPLAHGDRGPLLAIILPRLARSPVPVTLERLTRARALLGLAFAPRLRGLRDPDALRGQFQGLASVVRRIPVFEAQLPWGPPFAQNLGAQLCDALSSAGIDWW
ncbi:MAG: hypothetical protein KJ015_19620 [Myxococcales bacterium]|nr:hypothetical protein [Myxococcales bacterium]